ncbi:MAG: FkbM family methyltransferase [Candidatus Buchananbacteria bacterium]|nr:FkbM family methyltransferase [Candidatus Buchananbacteria bacterium]
MIKELKRNNLTIKMDVETDFEQHRFDTFIDKEPETITWIETLVKPGEVFFDVGANIGVYSLYAATFFNKNISVYCFEPVFHNFNKLCKNLAANGFDKICNPYAIAIADETKVDYIDLASVVSGSASHAMANSPEYVMKDFNSQFRQGVFCVSLDDLINQYGFAVPNHIKIDVDGFEEKVIAGAADVLRRPELKSILIEITDIDGAVERISQKIIASGFNTNHPVNSQPNHSRFRREKSGNGHIKNIIFVRDN